MTKIKDTSDATFDQDVLKADKPVLVDFWAPWCGPCLQIAPILEEIANENDDFSIVKLNVDENPQTAAAYGVMSIPTMNIYVDGEVAHTIVGTQPKKSILAELEKYVK
ncbi:MAG TPA: thioredoxin [Beutenbergiaceae bacterium]|nr:thioredoxin [Beutenbergiaceae bacterium]